MQPSPHKVAALGERYAVIIGINTYRDANIPPLRYAGNDAVAMRDFLVHPELGKFKKDNVHLLVDGEATLGDIRSHLVYWLSPRMQDQDEVWVYFSGRGTSDRTFTSATGQPFTNYLIAHDSLRDDLPGSAISIKQLGEWLDLLGEARVVLLFDCGFSAVDHGRAFATAKPSALDDFAFLPALTQGKKRFLLVGTGPTEISLEDTETELGLFSRVLLQRLRTAALTQNAAARMTWNEFYQTVAAEVAWQAEARGATQKPLKFGVLASEPIFEYRHVLTAPPSIPTREPQLPPGSKPAPESRLAPEPKPSPEPARETAPRLEAEPELVGVPVSESATVTEGAETSTELFQTDLHDETADKLADGLAPSEGVSPDVVMREHIRELLHRAQAEARSGNLLRAQDILEKAIALDPNDRRAATGLRKIEEAIRQTDATELVKVAFSAALRYADEKNYSEAMRYYARVLEIDPTSKSAQLGIDSCRQLLENQSASKGANGRLPLSRSSYDKAVHGHHLKSYNETIWPYIGWVALVGCIWQLFSMQAEGDSTAWVFWKTVASGLLGAVAGLVIGSIAYLGTRLAAHFEDRREMRMTENL
ncbi:MAG: caspase family protein [bacterium]